MSETITDQGPGGEAKLSGDPCMDLAEAVRQGLSSTPKQLPSRLFYDSVGSDLFELITELPEYYPTRTERYILETKVEDILSRAGQIATLIEFGSGSSSKTRLLIEALLRDSRRLTYVPIDISAEFLQANAELLRNDYPGLQVEACAAEYFEALESLPNVPSPRLFVFLGSNIGNFETHEAVRFLRGIRRAMEPEDRILLGIDLVKEVETLYAAYNDERGVTAAFNKNILARLNSELGANFDLDGFNHVAPWVPAHSRIEMHLESRWRQEVHIRGLGMSVVFEPGETIHTENSHKYTLDSLRLLLEEACLDVREVWSDPNDWFALTLVEAV